MEGDVQGVLSAHVNVLEGIEGALLVHVFDRANAVLGLASLCRSTSMVGPWGANLL